MSDPDQVFRARHETLIQQADARDQISRIRHDALMGQSSTLDKHLADAIAEFTPPKKEPTSMSVTGIGSAGQSLKAMMEAHKAKIEKMLQDKLANVQAGMDKQIQAVTAVGNLGDKVNAEGDDLLASVGQYANDLLGEG